MGKLAIIYDDIYLEHKPWYPHPENPRRLEIAVKYLKDYNLWSNGNVRIARPWKASLDLVYRVHVKGYVDYIVRLSRSPPAEVDPDTYVSEKTLEASLYAIGGLIRAYELYVNEGVDRSIALVRPPGHHAGKAGKAMGAPTQGFCIFNNIAILASYMLEKGYNRIAIVDIDVHHGNGTQEIFWKEPRVLHIDLHQDPLTLYPGTGFPEDIGGGEAKGTKINIVLPMGSGDDVFSEAVDLAITILEQYRPQAILFSAGFDAYVGDGLADIRVTANSFYNIGKRILEELKPNLVIATLEGGYSKGLSRGLPAFTSALLGEENVVEDEYIGSRTTVKSRFKEYMNSLKQILREYWSL